MKKLILVSLMSVLSWGYNADELKTELNASIEQFKEILTQKGDDKSAKIYEILQPHLDKQLIVRLVLGEYYKQAPAEFAELFFGYLRKDFGDKINLLDANVMELKATSVDAKRCSARAMVSYEENKKELVFAFRHAGNECLLYDMQVLDTSFIASYRSQFMDIIKQDGMNALIAKLKH